MCTLTSVVKCTRVAILTPRVCNVPLMREKITALIRWCPIYICITKSDYCYISLFHTRTIHM